MKAANVIAGGAIAWVLVVIAAVVGWVMNIYKIFTVGVPLAEFGVMEIMRIIGVFAAPLGAVLGYF